MSLKFQYNKTALQELNKQLKVRIKALPTLKNKESALRLEVKRARDKVHELDLSIQAKFNELNEFMKLYTEFDPSLVKIREIDIQSRKLQECRLPCSARSNTNWLR
jgi:V/A-type H+-transporting ATPase subunit D